MKIVEKSRQLSICIAVSKLSVFCYRVSVLVSGRKGDVIWHWFHSVKGTSKKKKIVRSLMISIGWLACYWQKGYLSHPFGEMWQGCIITSNTRLMQRIGKLRDTNRGKNFGPLRKRPIKAGSPTINWTFCSLRARPHFDLGRPFFLQILDVVVANRGQRGRMPKNLKVMDFCKVAAATSCIILFTLWSKNLANVEMDLGPRPEMYSLYLQTWQILGKLSDERTESLGLKFTVFEKYKNSLLIILNLSS